MISKLAVIPKNCYAITFSSHKYLDCKILQKNFEKWQLPNYGVELVQSAETCLRIFVVYTSIFEYAQLWEEEYREITKISKTNFIRKVTWRKNMI